MRLCGVRFHFLGILSAKSGVAVSRRHLLEKQITQIKQQLERQALLLASLRVVTERIDELLRSPKGLSSERSQRQLSSADHRKLRVVQETPGGSQ